MTYDDLVRLAKFLQQKYPTGGAITIAESEDFGEEWVSIDWEIRPSDIDEFMRLEPPR